MRVAGMVGKGGQATGFPHGRVRSEEALPSRSEAPMHPGRFGLFRSHLRALPGAIDRFVPLIMPTAAAMCASQLCIECVPHGGFDPWGRLNQAQRVERGSNACSDFEVRKSHSSFSV